MLVLPLNTFMSCHVLDLSPAFSSLFLILASGTLVPAPPPGLLLLLFLYALVVSMEPKSSFLPALPHPADLSPHVTSFQPNFLKESLL